MTLPLNKIDRPAGIVTRHCVQYVAFNKIVADIEGE